LVQDAHALFLELACDLGHDVIIALSSHHSQERQSAQIKLRTREDDLLVYAAYYDHPIDRLRSEAFEGAANLPNAASIHLLAMRLQRVAGRIGQGNGNNSVPHCHGRLRN